MKESREYLVFGRLFVDLVSGGTESRRKRLIQAAVARGLCDLLCLMKLLLGQTLGKARILCDKSKKA
jgi:hypothetical protein